MSISPSDILYGLAALFAILHAAGFFPLGLSLAVAFIALGLLLER